MTGLSLYCSGAALGLAVFAVAETQAPAAADVPWQLIANGSATAAVLVVGFFLLRRESQERIAERTAFALALREVTESLSEKMEAISARLLDAHERHEATLRDLTNELRATRRPNGAA